MPNGTGVGQNSVFPLYVAAFGVKYTSNVHCYAILPFQIASQGCDDFLLMPSIPHLI